MKDLTREEIVALLGSQWARAAAEGRHRDALMIGLIGLACARGHEGEEFGVDQAGLLVAIRQTASDVLDALDHRYNPSVKNESGRPCCSFCGKSAPEVRLVAGATGNICVPCATIVVDQFGKRS